MIHARIYKKCEENIEETQLGFHNFLGTREVLLSDGPECRDISGTSKTFLLIIQSILCEK